MVESATADIDETVSLDGLAEHMAQHNTVFSKCVIMRMLNDAVAQVQTARQVLTLAAARSKDDDSNSLTQREHSVVAVVKRGICECFHTALSLTFFLDAKTICPYVCADFLQRCSSCFSWFALPSPLLRTLFASSMVLSLHESLC